MLHFWHAETGPQRSRSAGNCDVHGFSGTQSRSVPAPTASLPRALSPRRSRAQETIKTASRYSSSTLGAVERSNCTVESEILVYADRLRSQQTRHLASRTASSYGCVDTPGGLLTRFHFQTGGLIPYQRLKGKPHGGELAEFGEEVYLKEPITHQAKLDDRWIGPVT